MPFSHGGLAGGFHLLLLSELLGIINESIVATGNVGAEALLSRLGHDAELVLAKQLVVVASTEAGALGLESLEAGKRVGKGILLLGADNVVLEGSVESGLLTSKLGRKSLGGNGCLNDVGEANNLLGLVLGLSLGLLFLLGIFSDGVQSLLVNDLLRGKSLEIDALSSEPHASAVEVGKSLLLLLASVAGVVVDDDLGGDIMALGRAGELHGLIRVLVVESGTSGGNAI